jgi:hypothetical protein
MPWTGSTYDNKFPKACLLHWVSSGFLSRCRQPRDRGTFGVLSASLPAEVAVTTKPGPKRLTRSLFSSRLFPPFPAFSRLHCRELSAYHPAVVALRAAFTRRGVSHPNSESPDPKSEHSATVAGNPSRGEVARASNRALVAPDRRKNAGGVARRDRDVSQGAANSWVGGFAPKSRLPGRDTKNRPGN